MEEGRRAEIKVVLIGDGGVGKTSIAMRYLEKGFKDNYARTIGSDFYVKKETYNLDIGKITIKWMIWDLGGQPTFDEVRGMYYKGAKAALLVFDVTRSETYYHIPNWLEEFWEHAGGNYPVVMVGNKIDLRETGQGEVPRRTGEKYSRMLTERMGYPLPYIESSAKENINIDKLFEYLARMIFKWVEAHS